MEDQPSSKSTPDDQNTQKESLPIDIVYIKGFPFPSSARFKQENIVSALNYTPLDDDLIVSSYPKTGTTWVEYIILQILHRGEKFPSLMELNLQLVPFMERTGAAAAEEMSSPRFIKFHLPYHLIPYNSKAKYIYVVRNPKDVVVSFYHFRREMGDLPLPFDEFVEYFIAGKVPFGNYIEHMASWLAHKDDENVLIVCYEALLSDISNGILRIAKFLGEDHHEVLSRDEELLNKIIKTTSFDNMSRNIVAKRPPPDVKDATTANTEQKPVKFFRKGTPGDWKNHLSPDQSRRMDQQMDEMLSGEEELLKLWKS